MNYLVDTSALTRIIRGQVDQDWADLRQRGLLAVCEPVLAETLLIAKGEEYEQLEESIKESYLSVTVPDDIWRMAAAVRRDLASHSAHRGMSVADFVVAATAIRLKLTVLHEDGDYETVARFVPELKQGRISAGSK